MLRQSKYNRYIISYIQPYNRTYTGGDAIDARVICMGLARPSVVQDVAQDPARLAANRKGEPPRAGLAAGPVRTISATAKLGKTLSIFVSSEPNSVTMKNDAGEVVDLYVPRKW